MKKWKMRMTEKFKILTQFIKDMSSETPDIETYLFVKDMISKYHLNIDITSKPLKNKLIEINTFTFLSPLEGLACTFFFDLVISPHRGQ